MIREKRSHKRQAKPAEPMIRYEIQGEFNPGVGGRTAVITDLSPSGMGLFTNEPLELGQVLRFIGGDQSGVSGQGQVIWTADSPEGRRVGIKFI
ncbi:MAG: PilZ domain-containing protein [Desulfobacteraceae bacterium]|nr:PilZ domain-containing protein [Desulfobacteraceae bacterium]